METAKSKPSFSLGGGTLWLRDALRAWAQDRRQRARFGAAAPLYAEGIEIPLSDLTGSVGAPLSRRTSGRVTGGDWDLEPAPLAAHPKAHYCLRHWRDGDSWEAAGAVDYHMRAIERDGVIDGCRTREDVDRRLEALDRVYEDVLRDGALKPKAALRRPNFRESGGILVHVGRDGNGLFGLAGNHRLAMALAAGLPVVPAQVGQVHPDGLPLFQGYRKT